MNNMFVYIAIAIIFMKMVVRSQKCIIEPGTLKDSFVVWCLRHE